MSCIFYYSIIILFRVQGSGFRPTTTKILFRRLATVKTRQAGRQLLRVASRLEAGLLYVRVILILFRARVIT